MALGREVALTSELALFAARLANENGLAMADGNTLTAARGEQATLWTQDIGFEGFPNVHCFPKALSGAN